MSLRFMKPLRSVKVSKIFSATILCMIFFLQACDRGVDSEEPCNFVQNSSLQRVSWKNDLPIKIYIHSSVKSKYYEEIQEAMDVWKDVLRETAFQIVAKGTNDNPTPQKDGYSTIYLMDSWEENKSTEQARTTIYWSGNQIYEADIRINDKNFDYFIGAEDDKTKVHIKSLMVHELGHVLGLGHNSEAESVMFLSLATGVKRDVVGEIDQSSIRCEY